MGYETEKAEAKRQQLEALFAGALQVSGAANAAHLTRDVVQQFADITAPYWEAPPMQLMTMQSGGMGGGATTKPGNIRLNIGKLVRAIATGTLTIAGAMTAPWTLVIGALVTWDALWSCLKLDINEDDACVIWTLWSGRDDGDTMAKSEVFEAVNLERSRFGKQPLSPEEVDRALDDLLKMRCVQQSKNDPDRWWLREWVRVSYQ